MKTFVKLCFLVIVIITVLVGSLFSTRVLDFNLSVDKVKLITDAPSIRDSILQHQRDARYVPYRIRLILFNDSVYGYQVLRNIANFWNLNDINKTILLANLYPVIVGFWLLTKQRYKWWFCLSGVLAGCLVIGINKMVNNRAATWFMLPIFFYTALNGAKRINLKFYSVLLAISLLMLI